MGKNLRVKLQPRYINSAYNLAEIIIAGFLNETTEIQEIYNVRQ